MSCTSALIPYLSFSPNTDQERAVCLAKKKHSFLLTGTAGTGKTTTLQHVINSLSLQPEHLLVCAPTGISSVVLTEKLSHHVSSTLNSAFGLMDGRHTTAELLKLFSGDDEYYIDRRKRLARIQLLIIDEVSMVSAATMDKINRILQYVRGSDLVMGGVQRIFCGDFLQLPPIANEMSGDIGSSAILSPHFMSYMPHKIELKQVMRTSDSSLIKAIGEVSCGEVSAATTEFLLSLNQPLPVRDDRKLVLFGMRMNAQLHNIECLWRHPGETMTYKSEDSGSASQLKRLLTPKVLHLKLGVPVMLTKNLSSTLVNGLRGHVSHLTKEGISVFFPTLNSSCNIPRTLFSRYDSQGKLACQRHQYPLILAYATTVHKSQGLSVEHLQVECEDMSYPGLLAVAISRAKSAQNLYINGFTHHRVPKPNDDIMTALTHFNIHCKDALSGSPGSCCSIKDMNLADTDFNVDYSEDDDEDTEETLLPVSAPQASTSCESSPHIANSQEVVELLQQQLIPTPINRTQEKINSDLATLLDINLTTIMEHLNTQLTAIWDTTIQNNIQPAKPNSDIFNKFTTQCYRYSTNELPIFLQSSLVTSNFHEYIHQLFMDLSTRIMDAKRKVLAESTATQEYPPMEMTSSSAGQGTIRRVAGRTVHLMQKMAIDKMSVLKGDLLSPDYTEQKSILAAIKELKATVTEVRDGQYPETAIETERRQYNSGGLTHVTDGCFELFLMIEKERASYQTVAQGLKTGENILKKTFSHLSQRESLSNKLHSILSRQATENMNIITQLYKLLLSKFLPVTNNTYRQRLLHTLERRRELAHRPKIAATGAEPKRKKHKSLATTSSSSTSDNCAAKPCVQPTDEQNIDWVACDACSSWFHRRCSGISDSVDWSSVDKSEWFCNECATPVENQ